MYTRLARPSLAKQFESFRSSRAKVLEQPAPHPLLDDLQQYADSEGGVDVASTTNGLPLDRLYETLKQNAEQVIIVITCRATDLRRVKTTESLRWLFEKVRVVEIPFLAEEQKEKVIDAIEQNKTMMDDKDDHTKEFDGTVGSLLLGLERKQIQYTELENQRNPGYLVLRAMKLLDVAGIRQHSEQRVRALAIQRFGGQELSNELTWSRTCEELEERQFLTNRDNTLVIRKDVYFDRVITDYPIAANIRGELVKTRQVFHHEADSEALLALGWTHNERKEFNEMLETSTIVVELTPGNARAHFAQGTALMHLKRDEEALAVFEQTIILDPAFAVGWNNKGFILDNLARYEEALAAYDEALKLNPQYAGAWYNKGVTLDKLSKYDEALTAYSEATKLNPHFADAWYNKGIALSRFSRNEEALTAFDEALAAATFDPTDAKGWNTRAEMLIALERTDEALDAYDEAIKLNQDDTDARHSKGMLLRNLECHEEALACFNEVLDIDPSYTNIWQDKGAALYDLKRYDEALKSFDAALKVDPQNAAAWNWKANIHFDFKRYEEAIACCDQALTIDPQFDIVWNNKGYFLMEIKRYEEAIASCDQAIALNPQYPNPYRIKALVLSLLQRYEEALVCLDEALAIDSQFTNAWFNKGDVLWQLKRHKEALAAYDSAISNEIQQKSQFPEYYEKALAAFEEAMQQNVPFDRAWYDKGCILAALNRHGEALAAFDEAIKIEPQDTFSWYNQGLILSILNRHEEALTDFNETIKLNPGFSFAWYNKGSSLGKLERYEEALATYEEAIKLRPQYGEAWYNKGITLEKLKRHEEALEAFEKAKKLKARRTSNPPGTGFLPGFGKYVSPDLVDDEFLDTEIIILLQGTNLYGDQVYAYLKLIGSDLKNLFAKMQAGENFKPTDYGTVLASGSGVPSQEIRVEMREKYNMIDVPITVPSGLTSQPKFFDDENV